MKWMGTAVTVTALVLAGCGLPGRGKPVPGATGGLVQPHTEGELTVDYLGKVNGDRLYTRCDRGNRLYFWTTMYGGKLTAVTDPTCLEAK